jgi:hypothetical protein
MAIDEAARHRLYERAKHVLDEDAAGTLMGALPRDPDRFATKDDLTVLEAALRGELHREVAGAVRSLQLSILASNATLVGLVFAAVRLA